MKLWGGRFTKETNQLVHNFNASIAFDQRFYRQDIQGSIAHTEMLEKQGIISKDERDLYYQGFPIFWRILKKDILQYRRNTKISTASLNHSSLTKSRSRQETTYRT